MTCINCLHSSTSVANSRPHKKQSSVWRRRTCPSCGATFTTIERPDLRYSTISVGNDKRSFNYGKLVISIAESFQHDKQKGVEHASDLADTVVTLLSRENHIDSVTIARTVHTTLTRFDPLAATAYAIQHKLTPTSS